MRLFALLLFLVFPAALWAQGAATLVADDLAIAGQDQLVASGNIEVLYDGTRMSASRIAYSRSADRLTIEGPIFIQTDDGAILTAERASLDPKLENGILRGARLILDQQMQMAANQIDRVDGRYSQLYRVAVSSCQVCGNAPPLWDIRADRVVHDETAQQIYFDNAILRLRGIPVFWLPRMRLPDPTLRRATGFLIPQVRKTDQLGNGIKTPYFVRLGDHRDITLTPYLSSETATLEAVYRQAFLNGDLTIAGAVSDDTISPDIRSYLFAAGQFALARGFQLSFDFETASDPGYLLDYGYSDKDRLDSELALIRVRQDDLLQARLTYYETLRDDEDNATLPPVVADISYEAATYPTFGGRFRYGLSADAAIRTDDTPGRIGRDVHRLGAHADWTRRVITPQGIVADVNAALHANWYSVNDDPAFFDQETVTIPSLDITLRWPLMRQGQAGTTHLIEPTLAIAWSDIFGRLPPNEDSTRAELDQANLLARSRFAGDDRTEAGLRGALGITWTRLVEDGANSTLTFGRVFRNVANTDFSTSSGLAGDKSDWLLAGQLTTADGLHFDGRTLFDDDLSLTRAAARIGLDTEKLSLTSAYIWQESDPSENRPMNVSEVTLDTKVQLTPTWTISVDTRYDIAAREPARAGLGLQYSNECMTIDLSVSRRYTSSTNVEPSTSYGLAVVLNGFSAGRTASGPAARCTE